MKLKLGLAQTMARHLDVATNMNRARRFIERADEQGCDLICFPELFLTGPVVENMDVHAQPVPGPTTDFFCALSRRFGIHIAMGSINESRNGQYFNTSVLIDDEGRIIGTYSKIFLWNGEKNNVTPGSDLPVFDTRLGKIGLQICWDLSFPDLTKQLVMQGAQLIINAAWWTRQDKHDIVAGKSTALRRAVPDIDTETKLVDACVEARALENGVVYAFVNGLGRFTLKGQTRELLGHTQVAVPFYGTVARMEDIQDLLVQEVDLSLVDLAEEVYERKKDTVLIGCGMKRATTVF